MSSVQRTTANEARVFSLVKKDVETCLAQNLVPFIQSSPGIGKSSMAKELSEQFNLLLIDYRISSADPTDFNGFPSINPITGIASYSPFDTFPVDTTPLPPKLDANGMPMVDANGTPITYDGWLLLMDELNHGNPSILRAAYKLLLDKKIGQRKLHPRVRIMAAGNLATDNAMTNKLGSALDSRVIQYFLKSDMKEWMAHANSQKFDYRITSFIAFKPDAINTFTSDTPAGPFPCERTWEFVHKLIRNIPVLDMSHVGLIAGAVGQGMANEFVSFTQVYTSLPTIQSILANPSAALVPTGGDACYAVSGLLANYADPKNIKQIITYIKRLKMEFAVISIQSAVRRTPELYNTEEVEQYIEDNYEIFKN